MDIPLAAHVIAGGLAILLGFVALVAAKGGRWHRGSGTVFVYAMVTMALMGAMLAVARGKAPASNAPMGLLTAYLVTTGFLTVRPRPAGPRWLNPGLTLLAASVGLTLFAFGVEAFMSPGGTLNHVPFAAFFAFGSIALGASAGDVRTCRAGGVQRLRAAARLTRHLWRMCVALLIATLSLGQATKAIPKSIRITPFLVVPPLAVLATLVYRLWRVRSGRSVRRRAAVRARAALSSCAPGASRVRGVAAPHATFRAPQ